MSQKVYERITGLVIQKMEAGTVPWKRRWSGANARLGQHKNHLTGKSYRGANAVLTYFSGFNSPKWLTYKQAKDNGLQVKKGEKGTPILFWNWAKRKPKEDINLVLALESEGTKKLYPFLKTYTVFNAQQIEGMEDELPDTKDVIEFNPIERAEKLLRGLRTLPKSYQRIRGPIIN